MIARAAATAIRLASVPLLVKRTRSIDGKRSQIATAEPRLGGAVRAHVPAPIERGVEGAADRRVRMAEKAGGEFGKEIDVFVAVGVPQMRAVAPHHRQRERLGIDRRAGVAAGQGGAGLLVQREAPRVARAVLLLRLGERGGEVDIRGMARAHRLSSVARRY